VNERLQSETGNSPTSFVERHQLLLLGLLAFLIYVPFLGLRDFWYPDEPDSAEVCLAMFRSGDWIAPRRIGFIWVDYPPMIYWTGTIVSHLLGGMSEFALRLPSALGSIAQVVITAVAGRRWFGARTGLWAGFALLTFQQFSYQAVCYRPDVLFSLFIAAGLLVYARGVERRSSWPLRMAGFALFGLAMLSKGPLGLLLPGLVLFLWHGSRREWRRMFELAPLGLVSLVVYGPWFIACAEAMGSDNMLYEFYSQNLGRFSSGSLGHDRPLHYFLVRFWIDLLPWAPLMPFALVWIKRTRLWRDRHLQLVLWWFGSYFVFSSIAATKRGIYLLPLYPAVAWILALWLARVGRKAVEGEVEPPGSTPARILAVTFAGCCAVGALVTLGIAVGFERVVELTELTGAQLTVARELRLPLVACSILCGGGAAAIGREWKRGDVQRMLAAVGATACVLYVVFLAAIMPPVNPLKTYRSEAEWIAERIRPETSFGLVSDRGRYYRKAGAFGYYSGALVVMMDRPEEIDGFLRRHPDSVVLVNAARAPEIFAGNEEAWRARVIRELGVRRGRFLVVGNAAEDSW
jgi:4-amino-4-deoxy-L-arabinose transferase-like glycosyltransferase